MPDMGPEYFADQFLETGVSSSQVRNQAGKQFAFRSGDLKLVDTTDTTKVVTFATSGVTTATERTLTIPDRDITLGAGAGSRASLLSATGGLTLTLAQTGSTIVFDAVAATAIALPAIAAADAGVYYEFLWNVTATGNHTITAQSADLLTGYAIMGVSGAADVDTYFPNASSHLIMTFNGTTTGGLQGSWARVTATSATRWNVQTVQVCTGTQATPFS